MWFVQDHTLVKAEPLCLTWLFPGSVALHCPGLWASSWSRRTWEPEYGSVPCAADAENSRGWLSEEGEVSVDEICLGSLPGLNQKWAWLECWAEIIRAAERNWNLKWSLYWFLVWDEGARALLSFWCSLFEELSTEELSGAPRGQGCGPVDSNT